MRIYYLPKKSFDDEFESKYSKHDSIKYDIIFTWGCFILLLIINFFSNCISQYGWFVTVDTSKEMGTKMIQ